jgi:hypothetical protein
VYCAGKNESLNIRQVWKRLRRHGHTDMMNNERMPKQIVTARMERKRTISKPRKRWTDEVEENLKKMGIRDLLTVVRDRCEWRRSLLQAKVHNGL